MIYELRIYEAMPGRLTDVLNKFREHTLPLWERHGIETVGFWTTVVGPSANALHYMLRWESLAERERLWATFLKDPDWARAKKETEVNGPIVASTSNTLLAPTDFSALK